jgi:ankyrin repeat protein
MSLPVEPTSKPGPIQERRSLRATSDPTQLQELHRLCKEGRLYEVEGWIREGKPLQATTESARRRRNYSSALEIALDAGNHSLVLLLLRSGYDPNVEVDSPLDMAMEARRWDLVDLLLEWKANPHQVDLNTLFDTYDSELFERFRDLGVDLTEGHELAAALAYHTSNKPAFGFARRHRESDPRIQADLNSALAHHASEGNEKGLMLCLWAGADPHAPARSLRFGSYSEEDEEEDEDDETEGRFLGFSAIHEACRRGNVDLLKRLGPDPSTDDYEELFQAAGSGAVVEFLAKRQLPKDVGRVIAHHLWWMDLGFHREWRSFRTLERIFEVGARWEEASKEFVAAIRRQVLRLPDRSFVDLLKLLALKDKCSPEILQELGRTPAIRKRMKAVGFIPPAHDDPKRYDEIRPTRSREVLKAFGVEPPKPPRQPLPRTVQIGPWRKASAELRLSREELFERVWSVPMSNLAPEWGLSGNGLAKACKRLKIPVPPRGYWAKKAAGKKVRRPRLPELPEGEAEEVLIWVPV